MRLRVTDDLALTSEAQSTISVSDHAPFTVWDEYELGFWGRQTSDDNVRLTVRQFTGGTAVAWCSATEMSVRDLNLALAKTSAPVSAADWDVFTLVQDADLADTQGLAQNEANAALAYIKAGKLTYGEHDGSAYTSHIVGAFIGNVVYVDLALIGGKPALYFYGALQGETGANMHYAYASTAHPTKTADWTIIMIPDTVASLGLPYANNIELAEVNGLPFVQSSGNTAAQQRRILGYCETLTPQTEADWHFYGLSDYETNPDALGVLCLQGAFPQLQYDCSRPSQHVVAFAVAQTAFPTQASDWLSYDIYAGVMWHTISAGTTGGVPVIVTNGFASGVQTELWVAQSANPADLTHWMEYSLPSAVDSNNRRVLDHGGQPGLLAVIDGAVTDDGRLVYRYPVP